MRDNVFSETDNQRHEKKRKQLAPGVRNSIDHHPHLINAQIQYPGRENLALESAWYGA